MIDPDTAIARCADLIEEARRRGADAADAVTRAEASESVTVRLGALEDVERSEAESIGLRVFVGQRSASIHTSDFSKAALGELAERAVAMARLAPEDEFAGLAPEDALFSGDGAAASARLELVDRGEPSPQDLREMASACEEAARAVDGVTNSNGGSASASRSVAALVTSHGFAQGYEASGYSLSASVVAGEGADKQTDYDYRSARHRSDLPSPESIGIEAGRRTVARLRPATMPSQALPVVFDPRVGRSLVGHLIGAIGAPAIARKASFMLEREDEPLFDPSIRILDDPERIRGLRSRPFDGEGVAAAPRALVENGRVTGWLTNVASARQLGIALTGHASRGGGGAPGVSVSNVHMEPGDVPVEALIADIADGVLVTDLFGQGINLVTGDYSRGAVGFRIRSGEIAEPVAEFTIAGTLPEMFRSLRAANDLTLEQAIDVPTLRIDSMTVAGE